MHQQRQQQQKMQSKYNAHRVYMEHTHTHTIPEAEKGGKNMRRICYFDDIV